MRQRLLAGAAAGMLLAVGLTAGALLGRGPRRAAAAEATIQVAGTFDVPRLHAELEAAGIQVRTVRGLEGSVEIVLADEAQEAQARAKAALHDPNATTMAAALERTEIRAAYQSLKTASTVAQVRAALLVALRVLYRKAYGEAVE